MILCRFVSLCVATAGFLTWTAVALPMPAAGVAERASSQRNNLASRYATTETALVYRRVNDPPATTATTEATLKAIEHARLGLVATAAKAPTARLTGQHFQSAQTHKELYAHVASSNLPPETLASVQRVVAQSRQVADEKVHHYAVKKAQDRLHHAGDLHGEVARYTYASMDHPSPQRVTSLLDRYDLHGLAHKIGEQGTSPKEIEDAHAIALEKQREAYLHVGLGPQKKPRP